MCNIEKKTYLGVQMLKNCGICIIYQLIQSHVTRKDDCSVMYAIVVCKSHTLCRGQKKSTTNNKIQYFALLAQLNRPEQQQEHMASHTPWQMTNLHVYAIMPQLIMSRIMLRCYGRSTFHVKIPNVLKKGMFSINVHGTCIASILHRIWAFCGVTKGSVTSLKPLPG